MAWSARGEKDVAEFFDGPAELREKAKRVAAALRESRHAIAFTGAGLSTSAGIPDFRSGLSTVLPTGPGLWAAQADYERRTGGVRNEQTRRDPTRPRVDLDRMLHVQPTFAHRALSRLVERNLIKTVLTQNVDNLHRKSGVPRENLVELHGNLQCEVCDTCGAEFERDFRVGPNPAGDRPAHYSGRSCERQGCSGWLRDYLVPFGEDLPKKETDRAWDESDAADFCLVLGSSMTVTPACEYAGWVGRKTHRRWQNPPAKRGFLAIANIQKTPYHADAGCVLHGFCDEVMRAIMEELGIEVDNGAGAA